MKFKFEFDIPEESLGKGETQEKLLLKAKAKIEKALAFAETKEVRLIAQKLVSLQKCSEDDMTQLILELAQDSASEDTSDSTTDSKPEKEEIEAPAASAPKTPKFPFNKKPSLPREEEPEEEDSVDEEEPEEEDSVEEEPGEEDSVEEEEEYEEEEDVEDEEPEEEDEGPAVPSGPPPGPPSSPPSKFTPKRPAKGMTGFAKKASPFKKLPRFKKPGE